MIRYLRAQEMNAHGKLVDTMFKDRAAQFAKRRGWPLQLDRQGWERDQYDDEAAIYAIYEGPDGSHWGSGRLTPTTRHAMVNGYFGKAAGHRIASPLVWESTRFVISPNLPKGAAQAFSVATGLMVAGMHAARHWGLTHYLGCYDPPMRRIWRRAGWSPVELGVIGEGRQAIAVGLWEIDACRWYALRSALPDLDLTTPPDMRVSLGEDPAAGYFWNAAA